MLVPFFFVLLLGWGKQWVKTIMGPFLTSQEEKLMHVYMDVHVPMVIFLILLTSPLLFKV